MQIWDVDAASLVGCIQSCYQTVSRTNGVGKTKCVWTVVVLESSCEGHSQGLDTFTLPKVTGKIKDHADFETLLSKLEELGCLKAQYDNPVLYQKQ